MTILKTARTAQYPLSAYFSFNFDDTMANTSGAVLDFGKTNLASTVFEIINLPPNAIIIGGAIVRAEAFDAATYTISIGDSGSATRYLGATDLKAMGATALVPTGYVNADGLNVRMTVVAADACTTGKGSVRVDYIVAGRSQEVQAK